MAAVAIVGLSLEIRREPEQLDGRKIVCRNDDVALLAAINGIDIYTTRDLGPDTLDMPAVDGCIGRPSLITVARAAVWLNLLAALPSDFVVKHLAAQVVHLENAAVH